ncbi:MAG: hypothetical protein WBE39_06490 [Candidatus Competibacter sp.]
MRNLLFFLVIFLFSSSVIADCGRLKAGDNYENLNSILDCLEAKRPKLAPLVNHESIFIAGEYKDKNDKRYLLSQNGIVDTNREVWSLQRSDNEFRLSWMTGPPIGHPQIGKLEIAPKLPEGFIYGVVVNGVSSAWSYGGLIAVRPEGNTLAIWSYHNSSSNYLYPRDDFLLTKIDKPNN